MLVYYGGSQEDGYFKGFYSDEGSELNVWTKDDEVEHFDFSLLHEDSKMTIEWDLQSGFKTAGLTQSKADSYAHFQNYFVKHAGGVQDEVREFLIEKLQEVSRPPATGLAAVWVGIKRFLRIS